MTSSSRMTLHLLHEDTGRESWDILRLLCCGAFDQLSPTWRYQVSHSFCPTEDNDRRKAQWNRWKNKDRREAQELADHISTRLLRGDVVVMSFDGDVPFSASEGGRVSPNLQIFEREVLSRVEMRLKGRGREALLEHLVLLIPFHNREAWLFQNFAEAEKILAEQPNSAVALREWAGWRLAPPRLDEEPRLKRLFEPLARESLRLAERSWPSAAARQVGTSFACAVERMRNKNGALVARLNSE